uniref:Putative ribonuclease H-like domain-containing protein n=1 Tax=Helianthus annuus TaxID=4232 RepID=A0A251U5K0_HELAN
MLRTLLAHASLPSYFWDHALDTATYLLNILPAENKNNTTPTEKLYHRIPTYDHLRVFGCLCYPLVPSTTIHKLEHRSYPCVFLGYPPTHRGYKCFNLETKQIIISRHVVFDETTFPFANNISPAPSYDFLQTTLSPLLWPSVEFPTVNQPSVQPLHSPQSHPTNTSAQTLTPVSA